MRSMHYAIATALVTGLVLTCGCSSNQVVTTPQDARWAEVGSGQARANARPMDEPPLLPMTHFAAGQLFERRGEFAKAIAQYSRAIELDESFAQAHNRLGMVLSRTGDLAKADQALARAVELAPESAQLRNNRGFNYLLQKRFEDLPNL